MVDRKMDTFEHLAELRKRIARCLVYLTVASIVGWYAGDWLTTILTAPMKLALKNGGNSFIVIGFAEAFLLKVQIAVTAGAILAFPFITAELWLFVAPGLTRNERKNAFWLGLLSIFLFVLGVWICYEILPVAFVWFAGFVPQNAKLMPGLQSSILFALKMLLAFGLCFELPVVLCGFAAIGLIDTGFLKAHWRIAVVILSIVAAVITPSTDIFSMLVLFVPLTGLYFLSFILVKTVQKRRTN